MKKSSIILLQGVIVLIGVGALALLLWEPHIEGRNVNATTFEIYFKDPFLAYAYTASIAFFIALHQAFKLLGFIGRNEVFSQHSVNALRKIRYAAITIVAFVVGGEAYLFLFQRGKEDIAGGVFIGLLMIALFGTLSIAAGVFERLLKKAVDMKSENDLTV